MSTNEKVSTAPAKATGAEPHRTAAGTAAAVLTDDDFVEEEYTPGEADGGMFGGCRPRRHSTSGPRPNGSWAC